MTEEKIERIKALSAEYVTKRQKFEALGLTNIYGRTPEENIALAQEAHVAEAEMLEAYAALKAAQQP